MTAIAETTNSQGASEGRGVNLRAFAAGGAASSALIAGAAVIFASLAAYVAFNGVPGGGEGADADAIVQVRPPGAPQAAAEAVGRAPEAVAATPAAPTPAAPAPAPAPAVTTEATPEVVTEGPTTPTTTVDTSAGDAVAVDPATQGGSGALGGLADNLDYTASNLGLEIPVGEVTAPITGPLDETVRGTLNNVGGLLGNPDLGDDVTRGLNNVTNALLGEGGLTDQILGGPR